MNRQSKRAHATIAVEIARFRTGCDDPDCGVESVRFGGDLWTVCFACGRRDAVSEEWIDQRLMSEHPDGSVFYTDTDLDDMARRFGPQVLQYPDDDPDRFVFSLSREKGPRYQGARRPSPWATVRELAESSGLQVDSVTVERGSPYSDEMSFSMEGRISGKVLAAAQAGGGTLQKRFDALANSYEQRGRDLMAANRTVKRLEKELETEVATVISVTDRAQAMEKQLEDVKGLVREKLAVEISDQFRESMAKRARERAWLPPPVDMVTIKGTVSVPEFEPCPVMNGGEMAEADGSPSTGLAKVKEFNPGPVVYCQGDWADDHEGS